MAAKHSVLADFGGVPDLYQVIDLCAASYTSLADGSAIDRAVGEGLTVVPLCPFARLWLERHPDVAASATIDWRQAGSDGIPSG